jgi:hypothetical protein
VSEDCALGPFLRNFDEETMFKYLAHTLMEPLNTRVACKRQGPLWLRSGEGLKNKEDGELSCRKFGL